MLQVRVVAVTSFFMTVNVRVDALPASEETVTDRFDTCSAAAKTKLPFELVELTASELLTLP